MAWQPAITIPTFICSVLSSAATAVVLFMWMISNDPAKKRSCRYALIINLTLAEFINSTNNAFSGGWVLINNSLLPNARSKAADFSILAIAVLTFLTLTFNRWVSNTSLTQTAIICTSVWIIPLITGTTALAAGKLEPVSGNWCWIATHPAWLRYALGHGCKPHFSPFTIPRRITIFAITIVLYTIIFTLLRKRLMARVNGNQHRYSMAYGSQVELTQGEEQLIHAHDDILKEQKAVPSVGLVDGKCREAGHACMSTFIDAQSKGKDDPIKRPEMARSAFSEDDAERRTRQRRLALKPRLRIIQSSKLDQETWHWFLLSAFPLSYLIVWIPGLANRFVELVKSSRSGHSSNWLSILQATTQLTGLVNAMVYGLREHRGLWRSLGERYYKQY
ncbi:hypothetical protein diail_8238 [Diaporthe ilicicola]|nr:hypothetical protein diail_8238 [Diaporthe ilicicola]